MKKPQPIRSVLETTIKSLEIDVPLKTYSILGAWNEIVGESVAAHSQPRTIRNRILFIDVVHPTWIQQLQFLKPTLLEKINTFLGEPLIQDVRFKLGKIHSNISAPPETLSIEDERLDKATLNRIEGLLQEMDDEALRNSLREVLIKGAKLQHYRKKRK
jgi:hypothetical protein